MLNTKGELLESTGGSVGGERKKRSGAGGCPIFLGQSLRGCKREHLLKTKKTREQAVAIFEGVPSPPDDTAEKLLKGKGRDSEDAMSTFQEKAH